jgi:hypothetical protein
MKATYDEYVAEETRFLVALGLRREEPVEK